MIIRRNQNIYPALYEPTILKIPAIKDAVMIGIFDEQLQDEKVFLIIEVADKQQIAKEKLFNILKNGNYSIAKEALPDEILFTSIPKCGRQQKTDKKQLKEWIWKQKTI